jgi:hypothetical protein
MLVANLIEIGAKLLETLSAFDIRTEDYKYLPLYADYEKMLNDGEKTSYIVAVLSERYKISEASVYRILRRFGRSVKS